MLTFDSFYRELQNQQLPQWIFVTPNLFDDGHNTDIRTSCAWTRGFVDSLLQDKYFNNNTLVYVTWQANGDAPGLANHVAGILLGSAVPQDLIGTVDDNYYNHYSELASIEANWNLHTLGRWDVGANVWQFVGNKTGEALRRWNPQIANGSFESYLWNQSYGGVFSNANDTTHTYVAPSLQLQRNGRTVFPAIANVWGSCINNGSYNGLPDYHRDIIELPDAFHPPPGFQVPIPLMPPMPITTPITAYPYSNPPYQTPPAC
jgi:Phosphoesterase family